MSVCAYTLGEACLLVVHSQLNEHDRFLLEIHEHLVQSQQQYKMYDDRRHRELEFEPGQWVLRLLHRPIASLNV
jgi:hypothetical protein